MSVVTVFALPLIQVAIQVFGAQIASMPLQQVHQIQIHFDVRSVLTDTPVVWFGEDVGRPPSSLRDGG